MKKEPRVLLLWYLGTFNLSVLKYGQFLFVLNTECLLEKILRVENKQLTVHSLPFIFVQNSHCFLCRKNQYNMVQCL